VITETTIPELTSVPSRSLAVSVIRRLVPWAAYVFATWLALRPLLTTAIVADDFLNPFHQYNQTGFHPGGLWRSAWSGAGAAGHFNYVGQIVGTASLSAWMWLISEAGLRFSTVYAATKLIVFVLCAVTAGSFTRLACDLLGRQVSPWRCRIVSSVALFGTLQLHVGWSNDPVGSYPLSGFASATVGFGALCLFLVAMRSASAGMVWASAGALVVALLYYEMNAALVGAAAPVVVWASLRDRRTRGAWPAVLTYAPVVVMPTLVAVAMQLRASPKSANYEGTAVAVDGKLLETYIQNVLSSLPGSAWAVSRRWLNEPFEIDLVPLGTFTIIAAFIGVCAWRTPVQPALQPSRLRSVLGVVVLAVPLMYWFGATLLQSATAKVQNETHGIGYVYNFYAVGATAIAVMLSITFLLVVPVGQLGRVMRWGALLVVLAYVLVQGVVNWNLATRFNEVTVPNQRLLVAYSEQLPVEQRCEALDNWTAGAWPDYYEAGMIDGLDHAYRSFHGEPFCPRAER
jgi:hypothetical protein